MTVYVHETYTEAMTRKATGGEKKDYVLQVRLTSGQREAFQFVAEIHGLDVSSWVRTVALKEANAFLVTASAEAARARRRERRGARKALGAGR